MPGTAREQKNCLVFDGTRLFAYLEDGGGTGWMVKGDIGYGSVGPWTKDLPSAGDFRLAVVRCIQPSPSENWHLAEISVFSVSDLRPISESRYALLAREPEKGELSQEQLGLLREWISKEIPPYMLKHEAARTALATLGSAPAVTSPRPRKANRSQNPNERTLRFVCRLCGSSDANAIQGGIVLRSTVGYHCPDCSTMICNKCQEAKVKERAAQLGVAGTVVRHLGEPYAYEDWYGSECQFCDTSFAMEMVFDGRTIARQEPATERQTLDEPRPSKAWWQFWKS